MVVDDLFVRARAKTIELLKVAKQTREQSPFDQRIAKLSDAQLALRHAAVEIVVLEMRLENALSPDAVASEQIDQLAERIRNGRYPDFDIDENMGGENMG